MLIVFQVNPTDGDSGIGYSTTSGGLFQGCAVMHVVAASKKSQQKTMPSEVQPVQSSTSSTTCELTCVVCEHYLLLSLLLLLPASLLTLLELPNGRFGIGR